MRKTLAAGLICTLMSASAPAQEALAPEPAEPVAEQIVITGQRPGPGLWKVSKGEHVLWIFGTHSPLPNDLAWRSQKVDRIIAQSQELIQPPRATWEPGLFRIVTLLPHLIGLQKNPDGSLLRDRVTPQAYERWLLLKKKYLGDDADVEKMRPYFAANKLYMHALRQVGLTGRGEVDTRIAALAKQHKLKVTPLVHKLEVSDPAGLAKEFKKRQLDDAACFATTLEWLDSDIDALRIRANAWAKGDLKTWRETRHADREGACRRAALSAVPVEVLEPDNLEALLNGMWLNAARTALERNASTFALLPLERLAESGPLLTALRAQGYTVDSPQE